jgi:hypothetical protein
MTYLSSIEAFECRLLAAISLVLVRLDQTDIGKSNIGMCCDLVKAQVPAKLVHETTQDGHEGKKAPCYQRNINLKALESLPF